jgi:hypothetical protein
MLSEHKILSLIFLPNTTLVLISHVKKNVYDCGAKKKHCRWIKKENNSLCRLKVTAKLYLTYNW